MSSQDKARQTGAMRSTRSSTTPPTLSKDQQHEFMRQFHAVWDTAQKLWPDNAQTVLCQALEQSDPLEYIEQQVESTTSISAA